MWYRVFGTLPAEVPPAALAEHLYSVGLNVEPHFKGDDLGWTAGELRLPAGGTPIYLERYLATADDLRADLNAYAAELETRDYSPNNTMLMAHVIQTQQLVTLRKPLDCSDELTLDRAMTEACQFLAARTGGVYQIDDVGWFTPEGEMLLQEY